MDRYTAILAVPVAAFLLNAAQIEKPPDFDDKPAFRQSAAGSLDSTSHIAGRAEAVATQLVAQLDSFEPTPAGAAEHRLFASAHNLVRQHHLAAAAQAFQAAARSHPESESLNAGAAITLFLTGRYDESAATVLPLARRFPRDPRLIPLLGETAGAAFAHKPAFESALRAFAQALPASGEARFYLARMLSDSGPTVPAEALRLWNESANLAPRDPRPCMELARAASAAGATADAIAWLERALARDPALPDAHYRLSRLYSRKGDTTRAASHLAQYQKLRAAK